MQARRKSAAEEWDRYDWRDDYTIDETWHEVDENTLVRKWSRLDDGRRYRFVVKFRPGEDEAYSVEPEEVADGRRD